MKIEVNVYHHFPSEAGHDRILAKLNHIEGHIITMTETSDRLAREVQETRDAVTALTGRYQTKIDAMQVQIDALKEALANGDTAAANAAADALDSLQTDMAALGQTTDPVPEPPAA